MLTGPQGQKRPADVIGCAVKIGRLSVGDDSEDRKNPSGKVQSGHAGAKARMAKLSPQRRVEIEETAAAARWKIGVR
ncbi:MAG TPA: RNA-binding protein [Acetobacteraceae bacterium]|jgi:hypothetical protein|nr:RNA-binding protein [Acetobacteraceae bacterium]